MTLQQRLADQLTSAPAAACPAVNLAAEPVEPAQTSVSPIFF
jgi:hypothetical protein